MLQGDESRTSVPPSDMQTGITREAEEAAATWPAIGATEGLSKKDEVF